jgi:hypothetical protein
MTSVNKDVISNHAAMASISFFIALFGCSFVHGQQEEDTTSIPAFGKLTHPMSTPTLKFTSLSPPIPLANNNIAQQQEQIIGSDHVIPSPSPSPSLSMDKELTTEEQNQQLNVDETLNDPRTQSKLIEEEKEKAELEIKQRLDDVEAGGEDVGGASNIGGAGEERNNQEDDTSSDPANDNEAPFDLKLPVPFP